MADDRRDLSDGSGWWEASDGRWYPPVDRRPPPPVSYLPPDTSDTTPAGAWLAIAGGVLMATGTLLPWVTVAGVISRNGFQMGTNESVTIDGPVCLILGLVTVVIGITRLTRSTMPRFLQRSSIATGIIVGVVLAADYAGIHGLVNQIGKGGFIASIGYGYWVCGVGAVVAVAGGIVLRSAQPALGGSGTWLVVILVLGGAAVLLGLNVSSGTATPSTSTTVPTVSASTPSTTLDTLPAPSVTQDYQAVEFGCASLQAVGGMVSQASDENSAAPLTTGSAGPQWRDVSSMEVVGNDPTYQQIASEARTFVNSWTVAETTGDVTAVNDSIARLVVDCQALNLYPQ